VIIIGSGILAMAVYSGVQNGFSVFYFYLVQDFDVPRAQVALISSLQGLIAAVTYPLLGYLTDRLGGRFVIVASLLCTAGGLMLGSVAQSLWHLYLSVGALCGIGMAGTLLATLATVPQRVAGRRNLVTSIITSGQGFGILILAPIIQYLATLYAWRGAYLVLGAGILVCAPVLWWGLALPSRSKATAEDGGPDSINKAPTPVRVVIGNAAIWRTVRAEMRFPMFWLFFTARLMTPLGMGIMYTNHFVYMVEQVRTDPTIAALAVGAVGALAIFGNLSFGMIADARRSDFAVLLSVAITVGGMAMLGLAGLLQSSWMIIGYVLLFGITYGARNPIYTAMGAEYYKASYGTLLGLFMIGNGIGRTIGPWLGGATVDLTGNYILAFSAAALALSLAGASAWGIVFTAPRRARIRATLERESTAD